MLATRFRTHSCGEINEKNLNKKVKLCGFVSTRRDHGGVIFIDLRDRYGVTQLVFNPKGKYFKEADKLRREDVICIDGVVKKRPKGMENKKIKTGRIEVIVDSLDILNKVDVPPFEIEDRIDVNEDIRLKYRYLDLRRMKMQKNLIMRYDLIKAIRDYMDSQKFIEVETPILTKSTPEGARDYLVPSRVNPGQFFALPQSPQLFKQILMVAGYDRYFQIARCFRDEDLRADRQPEFTQLDIEMSFIDEGDLYKVIDELIKYVFKKLLNADVKTPIKRMSYDESMDKYGCDSPDLRFGLELIDITEIAKRSDFNIFKNSDLVKCIMIKDLTRKDIEDITAFVGGYGAKGLSYLKMGDKLEGSVAKFFNDNLKKELVKKTGSKKGEMLLIISGDKKIVNSSLAGLRLQLGKKFNLIKDGYNFVWITDFPLLEWSDEDERYVSMHHPFTSPKDSDVKLLDKTPEKAKAKAYDLVLNGSEIGGGSIRIHDGKIQQNIFDILKISKEESQKRFGFLLDALKYAVPHGGIAFGLDRVSAIITGNDSIREVIAFPKNKEARCLMTDAPSDVDNKQLKELGIKLDLGK